MNPRGDAPGAPNDQPWQLRGVPGLCGSLPGGPREAYCWLVGNHLGKEATLYVPFKGLHRVPYIYTLQGTSRVLYMPFKGLLRAPHSPDSLLTNSKETPRSGKDGLVPAIPAHENAVAGSAAAFASNKLLPSFSLFFLGWGGGGGREGGGGLYVEESSS